jgi:hypothetical protein
VTKDASCPAFTTLYNYSLPTNTYRLYFEPPLTNWAILGLNYCKLILTDGTTANVEKTFSINVLNRAPYFNTAISSKRVGVDGQRIINTLSSFSDYEGHSLTIKDASYTLNSQKYTIPFLGSFFTIDSSKNIKVDPSPDS